MSGWAFIHLGVGAAVGGIWLWHAVAAAFGMRRIADITAPEWNPPNDAEARWPRVSIIVPARDEEAMIAAAVRSLLGLEYPNFEVIAIDDRSADGTGAMLDEIASGAGGRLKVIHVRELPKGWLGKTHAMHVGAEQAKGEWLLFTDADVVHSRGTLRRAVNFAERERVDHLVVLPTVVTESWGERMIIALFQSLFIFAHKPWKVSDPKAKDYLGTGAFNLVREASYRAVGGYERLRLAVIDDMQLGRTVKRAGFRQQAVSGPKMVRVRWAHGLLGVVRNTEKNFFAEFGFKVWLTLAAVLGVVGLQLGPWLGLLLEHGWAKAGYAVALLCVLWVYNSERKRTGISSAYILLHWLASVLLVYAILRSMVVTLRRSGVVWRGTKYSLAELRREPGSD